MANDKNFVVKNGLIVGQSAEIGSTLFVPTIDTADSSAISITPAAVFNSDVTVENDLRVQNDIENTSGNTLLPATLGTANYVLKINSSGTGAEWQENNATKLDGQNSAYYLDAANLTGSVPANFITLATDTSGDYVASISDAGNNRITVGGGTGENAAVTLDIADNGVELGTKTTGNYVATITGTANEVEVSGSGSETAAVTVGLPNDVTIGNELTVTTGLFTPLIDTTDSSAITVVPSVVFNSDVNIQNDLRVTNAIENASGNTLLPAALGTADQVLTVNSDGLNASWKSITDIFGGGIDNVIEDTTPQLGGNLDLNTQSITGTGNINITGDITASNNITATTSLFTPIIDTTDSSAITVVPAATFNSNLTVENSLIVGNDVTITGNTTSTGDITAVRFIGDGSALTNLQITLGSQTTGNYMENVSGTTNEIEITHTPGEGSTATIGLPDNVTIGNELTVTTGLFTPLIDTTDSSTLTITPAVTMNSDLTVENDLVANGNVTASAFFGDGSNLTGISTTTTFVDLTDTDVASQATDTLIKYDGTNYVATSTSEDSSGNVTIAGQLNVSTIDTTDSSAISVTPAATFNSDVTVENSLLANNDVYVGHHIDFSTTAHTQHAQYQEGRLWYDSIHKTFNYYSDIPNVVHELGIEEHIRVYNNSGSTITRGQPLYFTGNHENGHVVPTVGLANATSSSKYDAQGLAAADIANGEYGFCQLSGQLFDLDTSGLTAGQHFYVGLTDGALQNASPAYPNYPVLLGWVVKSHATDGVVNIHIEQHTVDTFRTVNNTHFGSDVVVDGDLTVNGTQTITSQANISAGSAFIYLNTGDTIGEANTTFTGSGLDDAYFSGHYTGTGTTNYYVRIDSTGTPDTFEWSKDNFSSTEATGVAITGSDQTLDQGISINFGATTGHTSSDVWSGTAAPTNIDTGFFSNRNTGGTGVGYTHAGLFFDVTDEKWKLVEEYDPEPNGTIDTGHASYNEATLSLDTLEAATGTFSTAVTVGGNNVLTTASEIALGTSTTGNYVATITGTANEVEVSGSGSETAAVTVGLPNDVTIGNELTVTTGLFTPLIDTTDSSAITVVPSVVFNSDVNIQNDLRVTNAIENISGNTILPATLGTTNQVLTVNADGNAEWSTISTGALNNVVEDTTPQLGGNLDLNSQDITGTGNIDVTGNITASNNITATTALFTPIIDTTDSSAITVVPATVFNADVDVQNTLRVNAIDSVDSSTIIVTPGVVFNSDVTVENDLRVVNDIENSSGETILPVTLGSANQVLTVNSTGDAAEWKGASGNVEEYPTVTNGSANVTMSQAFALDTIQVFLNGIKLRPTSEFTVSGTTLTLSENLVSDDLVTVVSYSSSTSIETSRREEYPTVTNGSANVTMGQAYALTDIDVYLNGAKLKPTDDFTVSGTTLTLGSTLTTGDVVTVVAYQAASIFESLSTLDTVTTTGNTTTNNITVNGLISTGNVGIGTSSPNFLLDVEGASNSTYLRVGGDDANNDRGLRFTSSASASFNGAIHTINAPSSQGEIAFATNSSEAMRIDETGKVGIGTTNPDAYFHVDDKDGTGPTVIIEGGGTNQNTPADGEQTLFLKTGDGTGDLSTGIGFFATFENTPADTDDRRAADIRAGFDGGAWGNEYISFHIGKGTGSTSNDAGAMTDERLKITKTAVVANVPIQDDQGNVRALEVTTDATSSVTIASGSSGKYFRLTGTTVTININAGNFAAGDIITLHNATASAMTIDFDANFTDTVYIAGDGTDKNNSTITLAAYGLATCTAFTNNGMIVAGNVS